MSASTGDVDGDGDVDVILERTDDEILWLENDGGTPIAFAAPASITGTGVLVRASALFDADGDGDLDLAAVVGPAESLQIAINGGGGVFGPLV
ncbi:MAG: FG-GAP-like repeat-containing protein, partial [Planctomycetota bacterium]